VNRTFADFPNSGRPTQLSRWRSVCSGTRRRWRSVWIECARPLPPDRRRRRSNASVAGAFGCAEVTRREIDQEKVDAGPAGSATYRLMAEAPRPAAEAFRNLRLRYRSWSGSRTQSFLFTSALRVKKKFHQRNYALSLAQQGHRVLLVDGDLRRPVAQDFSPDCAKWK